MSCSMGTDRRTNRHGEANSFFSAIMRKASRDDVRDTLKQRDLSHLWLHLTVQELNISGSILHNGIS